MHYQELLKKYPIISDQIKAPAMGVVLRECEQTLRQDVTGDIVELGCYIGTTTLFLRRLLDHYRQSDKRQLYAYDSFEGLPPKHQADQSTAGDQFKAGELTVSKKQFLQQFQKAGLRPPITVKGWFNQLTPDQVPEQIAYAFLDGDFYESILDSLQLVWPKLSQGGRITIDDYGREALPGVERAVSRFFQGKAVNVHHEHHIAVITRR